MTDVILFHHAQGRTNSVLEFADQLRHAGHRVSVPDLYDGATFGSIEAGVAYAEQISFDRILKLGADSADGLPTASVYAGFSPGALPAQQLAQNRAAPLGAHTHLTIDLVKGRGSGFSLEAPEGVRLLIRSRLLTTEELAELDAEHHSRLGQPPSVQ